MMNDEANSGRFEGAGSVFYFGFFSRFARCWRLFVPMLRFFLLGSAIVALSFHGQAAESFVPHRQRPVSADPALKELSGLARSGRDGGLFWALNDSGNSPVLYLLDGQGQSRGWVGVAGEANTDWEDFDAFTLEGRPYLLVADTGDNLARRIFCTLFIVPEPRLAESTQGLEIRSAWKIQFRYPGGPRDCESVAVDPWSKEIFLISKRTWPQELYSLPLRPLPSVAPVVARRRGIVNLPEAAPWEGPYASQSTGLAFNPEGNLAAVLTYARVFLFVRQTNETWEQAFARKPEGLRRHGLEQAEGLAFSADGKQILVMSEGVGAAMVIYQARGR